ncbi:Sec-independent protein translocase subunit TatA [Streptomyces sp. NBC_01478]|uniref:Sec-independent protein translocase subunit TatA n=1 Tax=Streptomyces sp. NBC_01478 TaxID=2903882 RepID=UPI002E3184C3|nr:Sec-independent protein translocase subunit TatA [Streptomyces sp. NBC_01478]
MLRNGLEPWHLLVVAIVVILLFGSKKLPEAARGLGKSMRILKSEAKAMKEEDAVATPASVRPTTAYAEAEPSPVTTSTEPPATAH